jgi:hypothetical protein
MEVKEARRRRRKEVKNKIIIIRTEESSFVPNKIKTPKATEY